jgi:hypothetical protein
MKFSRPWSNTRNAKRSEELNIPVLAQINRGRLSSHRLDAIHSRLNDIAQRIRLADKTTATIETFIDKMKARLKTILKQYPPFPAGSEERVRLLRSFNAFRKQIDQLTIPPREDFAKMVTANLAVVHEGGDVEAMLGDDGLSENAQRQKFHPGLQGFELPKLSEDATDDKVFAFLENLDAFTEKLRQRRAAMVEQAVSIGGRFGDISETDIQLKSLELRDTIKTDSIASLTKAQPQLMELL